MSAVISADQKYRYRLTRQLVEFGGSGALCFVLLNPSTADATNDDPTIRRCCGFAKSLGCARLEVVNLFAYRSTSPDVLYAMSRDHAVGPENDQHILDAIHASRMVICAWGNHGTLFDRAREVTRLIDTYTKPFALKINAKTQQPAHPLYLKRDSKLVPMP